MKAVHLFSLLCTFTLAVAQQAFFISPGPESKGNGTVAPNEQLLDSTTINDSLPPTPITFTIHPFLQTPTATSIYVNWLSAKTDSTRVIYGTTDTILSMETTGSHDSVSNRCWHTVKLNDLVPNTTYYYRCISGSDTSAIAAFHTPPMAGTAGGHIIFGLISDSQDNYQAKNVADNMKAMFIKLYGEDWYTKVNCIMHTGDAVADGSNIDQYETQLFNNYYALSAHVPFMFTMGNHELSASGGGLDSTTALYYKFLKYEELSPYKYPDALAERFYSFQLGNMLYVVLNTNTQYQINSQINWLDNTLRAAQADTTIDFVFVSGHHPGRVEIWLVANNNFVLNNIYNVLKKYSKVAAMHHGHEHAYERGTILSTHADNKDFRTIVSGGGGGWLDHWGDYVNITDQSQVQKTFDHWEYTIYDINMDEQSYLATTYSLGNLSYPLDNVIIDQYHGRINQPAPEKPLALSPSDTAKFNNIEFIASDFVGEDSIMSSQFQLTFIPGNYSSPFINITRDHENIFHVTDSFEPINKNAGINLYRYKTAHSFTPGNTYAWRVRYRDQNLRWSPWSEEALFTATDTATATNIADVTENDIEIIIHQESEQIEIRNLKDNTMINIYDSLGQAIVFKTVHNHTTAVISYNHFSSGMYYLSISTQTKQTSKEFIKK